VFGSDSLVTRWGLIPLRCVVGLVFVMHGGLKVFVFGLAGTTAFMTQVGVPFPALSAVVVMAAEFLGGLAIFFGLFTRWAAAALVVDMAVAILTVRLKGGFFAPNGFELELTLMCACLTLVAVGSGAVSLDGLLRRSG
jgi:putative oxidoreductase